MISPKRLSPSRLTIRARLTLFHGGLFLVAGLALLAVTYLLLDHQLLQPFAFNLPEPGMKGGLIVHQQRIDTGNPDVTYFLSTQADDLRQATRASLLTQGAVALAVVGAFAVAVGWLLAGRLLAPLHRITETARRIGTAPAADRGLHERIALAGPRDEIRELADTFDAMLARLDQAFDGQRRFVANASHELRTPLTLNRSLVELAMHRRTATDDVKRLGETLLEINIRHERLINGLLLLARSENEISDRSPVDLADVVEHVVDQSAPEAMAAEVQVHAEADTAELAGDPVLLERLVQNLVDNGIRHNTAGGWVRVASRTLPDGRRELTVSNTGPVVPRYEIPVIFEPFRRLGRDRVTGQGAGLGLSIVAAITRAHGGEVVANPREGGGLVVSVRLPEGPAVG